MFRKVNVLEDKCKFLLMGLNHYTLGLKVLEVLPWPWQPVSHQALGLLLFSCVAKGVSVYFNLRSLMSEV